jgi:hypothetical protein
MIVWLDVVIVPEHIFVVLVEPPLHSIACSLLESKSHATGQKGLGASRALVVLAPGRHVPTAKANLRRTLRFSAHPFASFICRRLHSLPLGVVDPVLIDRQASTR